jgi:hypothetical protein
MRWQQLLFMHWPVPADALRPMLPPELDLDTFDGSAWIGVVPFRMTHVRHRFSPPTPWLSALPELNVRTYVKHNGNGGVWFFSLDAASRITVRGARRVFHLPYFDARMSCRAIGNDADYSSKRTHRNACPCEFKAKYRPTGPPRFAVPGSLDDFLTNRLSLYAADRRGRIFRGDIEHPPWPLQPAEADIELNSMTDASGIKLPQTQPLLHYSHVLDVRAWRLKRASD